MILHNLLKNSCIATNEGSESRILSRTDTPEYFELKTLLRTSTIEYSELKTISRTNTTQLSEPRTLRRTDTTVLSINKITLLYLIPIYIQFSIYKHQNEFRLC